jgi:Fe-S cluster biosynthesis and repair protein YggX
VGYPRVFKDKVLGRICASCWKEWEGMEVKVINEYRLNFMDPQHREMLQKACSEFLQIAG